MAFTEVHLQMKTAEGRIVNRNIDISNLYVNVGDTTRITMNLEQQRELLEEWIELRGNDQHDTKLTLIYWGLS